MRNPLGSPDVMGFNTGAWSGVLVAMVLFGQDLTAIATAAMVGGIVTSLLVWLLARRNGIDTFRLIIIGIGVRAMLVAFNTAVAESVFRNGANSGFVECRIAQRPDVGKTSPSAPIIILMLIAAALLVRRMRLLEMGDDTACALGVSVERSRLLMMLVAVVLTAAATASGANFLYCFSRATHCPPHQWHRSLGLTRRRCAGVVTAGGRSLRPTTVYAVSTSGWRRYRQPRRYLPYRLVNSGVSQK